MTKLIYIISLFTLSIFSLTQAEAYFDDNSLKFHDSEIIATTNGTAPDEIEGIQFKNKIVVSGNIIFDDRVNFFDDLFIGMISPFASAAPPAGWLLCDGAEYAITAHPKLAERVGSKWDASSGGAPTAGNFRVPDLDLHFLRPTTNATVEIQTEAVGFPQNSVYTVASNDVAHSHVINDAGFMNSINHGINLPFNVQFGFRGSNDNRDNEETRTQTSMVDNDHTHNISLDFASVSGEKLRPKHMVVRYYIYAGN